MDWKTVITDGWLAVALIATIAAITVIVIVSGASSLATTDLPILAIALASALAGTKIPKA